MSDFLERAYYAGSSRLLNFMDATLDRRICGCSLVKYVPSVDRDDEKGIGGTGSQSTHYIILKKIFSHVRLEASDAFLDVGCGKGRVIAYLINAKCPCQLYGIEHNETVGRIAQEWVRRYPYVHITVGDAFAVDYNEYTVLSIARSFLSVTRLAFIVYLERHLRHPITLIHWYGAGPGLEGRKGWKLQYRGKLDKICGLKVGPGIQDFSIWEYDPAQRT